MSRYIDADAIKDKAWKAESEACFYALEDVVSVTDIDEAPSIDIVRCKECIHCADDYIDVGMGTMPQFTCELGRCGEFVQPNDFCSYGSRSEKPNNCEHITEDGVTCAKYPACDDCLDNPLNNVKGSERLVKGSERSSE